MALKNRLPRLSVQTKVLIPVLVFLVLLPTVTVWIVSNYITRQMQSESERTLGIAETVFQKLLNIRAADLLTRYRNEVSNANFKGLTTLRDTPTMNFYLGDLLDKFPDDEMALLLDDKGAVFAWSRKDSLISVEEFAAAGSELVRPALLGETGAGSVALNGRDYLIVAVPVIISGNGPAEWVLLVANRLGENAVQEFKSLTNTEIVLLAHVDNVAASTLQSGEGPGWRLPRRPNMNSSILIRKTPIRWSSTASIFWCNQGAMTRFRRARAFPIYCCFPMRNACDPLMILAACW